MHVTGFCLCLHMLPHLYLLTSILKLTFLMNLTLCNHHISNFHCCTFWAVKVFIVYFWWKFSIMFSHLTFPQWGHLEELFNLFVCLQKNHNAEMVFTPSVWEVDMESLNARIGTTASMKIWQNRCCPMPPSLMTKALCCRFMFDSDHHRDSVNHYSMAGLCVFLHQAPPYWLWEATWCRTSTFHCNEADHCVN